MSYKTSLTKEEQQTEALLGQFYPIADVRSRDKLMFHAGRASAGSIRLWQGTSGVFVALFLCSLMIHRAPSQTEPATVTQPLASNHWQARPEVTAPTPMDAQAYIRVRRRVLGQGLDALPSVNGARDSIVGRMRYGEVLKTVMAL
jgi:hypothetical protein